jgi:hypothetical protein
MTLDLTASFSDVNERRTPFGIYDSDSEFSLAADAMVQYVYHKLGGSTLRVELENSDVYSSLEEAALEYSAMTNVYHAKSILADMIGSATGSLTGKQNQIPRMTLELAKKRASAYGSEAGVGGTRELKSGSISLSASQQVYDLNALLSASGLVTGSQKVEIREVFHFSPTAAYRFFDTTSAVNYLHNQFSFESFTPETVFYMLPIWEDVLRAQQLEQSHRVRRSNYSYNIVNNDLILYPVPTESNTLYFKYYLIDPNESVFDSNDPFVNGVSNLSNVPFDNITYSKINSIGKHWIRRFALCLSKEILGQIRSKVSDIPIPNGSLVLNGPSLIAEARDEQNMLREELKLMLESTTYQALAQQEMDAANALKIQMNNVPMGLFIG